MRVVEFDQAKLRELRHARGLTIKQLAAMCNLTHSAVTKIERGIRRPSLSSALVLADALGVDLEILLVKVPAA